MIRNLTCLLIAVVATSSFVSQSEISAAKKTRAELIPVQDNPELPRVLLIGDSISIGYTLPTRDLLKGKANVHRVLTNCGPTIRGVSKIDRWLGTGEWDVIHFNWGLHDIKLMPVKGSTDRKAAGAHHQVSIEQYEKNLRKLVKRLKKTGAELVWCSTTPVPEGAGKRVMGDEVKYNKVAAKIMKEEGIAVDDLYSYSKPNLKDIQRPKNVHFTPKGSKVLAEQVVKSINIALKKKAEKK